MAIFGLDLTTTKDFYSRHDTAEKKGDKTCFKIRPLDSRVYGMIRDRAFQFKLANKEGESAEGSHRRYDVNFQAVAHGIEDIVNFTLPGGEAIEIKRRTAMVGNKKYEVLHDDVMRLIPGAIIDELAQEIMAANELDEKEGNA